MNIFLHIFENSFDGCIKYIMVMNDYNEYFFIVVLLQLPQFSPVALPCPHPLP